MTSMDIMTREKLDFISRSHGFETTMNDQRKNVEGNIKSIKGEADKSTSSLQSWVSSEAKVFIFVDILRKKPTRDRSLVLVGEDKIPPGCY